MTSFVHVNMPAEHPGVARAENFISAASDFSHNFEGVKSLAAVVLSAIIATLIVVADKLITFIADGGTLFAWLALWTVAFGSIAVFAGGSRNFSARITAALNAWSAHLAKARADERLWAFAQTDERVMRELQIAMVRAEPELAPLTVATAAQVEEAPTASIPKRSAVVSFMGGMFEAANMRLQRNSTSYFM